MEYSNLVVEKKKDLCLITINRPEVHNALNPTTVQELHHLLDQIKSDDDVKIVVFKGAGEKAFSAGADITSIPDRTINDAIEGHTSDLCKKVDEYDKPTIALIDGYALGGGFELALSCDIRIVSNNSKLGLPELHLSILPGAGGTQRLSRMVGVSRAIDMILTGKKITAEEAYQFGIAQYICDRTELSQKLEEVTNLILNKGPLAVTFAKKVIKHGNDLDLNTGLLMEKFAQAILYTTEDKREGATAFLEKRKPNFKRK